MFFVFFFNQLLESEKVGGVGGGGERDLLFHLFMHSLDWLLLFFFFLRFYYLSIFRERGMEGEKHQCVVASHVSPTGDLACNPGMCPDWKSNQ